MNDNDSPLGKPHFAGCVCVTCEQQKAEAMTERTVEQICRDLLNRVPGNTPTSDMDLAPMANEMAKIINPLRQDAERWRKHASSMVSELKHIGPFKRKNGDDPHPLDCTLAGRVSHVFGVGMTSAISLCKEFGQDPEWRE